MKKILLLPLDERPCNYNFPLQMPAGDYTLLLPPKEILGDKKQPADFAAVKEWLLSNVKGAYGLILSADMLCYGGIVPSRLHYLKEKEIEERLDLIGQIRKLEKGIIIYAFQLIMRCPAYSSSDEEPDYYETCGINVHRFGYYNHLEKLNMLTAEQKTEQAENLAHIKPEYLDDYLTRRQKNMRALKYTLKKVKDGLIDYFIVPQDDAAVYAMTSLDQMGVRDYIRENGLQKSVNIYPGADEVGMTLLARMICRINNAKPKIFVHYASSSGAKVVPSFEDRIIDETIKYQIYAAGALRVYSLPEADILAAVNIGSEMEDITPEKYQSVFDVNRNLCEFTEQIDYALSLGKYVAVCDIAQANGGDAELVKMLCGENLFFRLGGYAGWNTSSNTIGTALCQCIALKYSGDERKNKNFLVNRVLEDICYCSHTRKKITDERLPALGLNYFDSRDKDGIVAGLVSEEILNYAKEHFPEIYSMIKAVTVSMPWRRMFEVDINAQLMD